MYFSFWELFFLSKHVILGTRFDSIFGCHGKDDILLSRKNKSDFDYNPYYDNQGPSNPSPKRKLSKKRKAVNITVIVLSCLFLLAGGGCMYAENMIRNANITGSESFGINSALASQLQADPADPVNSNVKIGDGATHGLYRDDAVMNILLLGVDDYQPNDIGRSDSIMLLTIDTRHQKIKLTSFMRDMYVQIPGYSPNRVNVAYSLGGPPLAVQTLESNFGVDIDRFVIIDYDHFEDIIDTLGGVEMEITKDEADLINRYSGESSSKRLTGGTHTLTGKQARYYSRIRAIGNDQARTERQRKVVTSLVNKLKQSDLFTINNALSKILNMITTNINVNEMLALAGNAMTYLSYPVEQNRIPVEGAYDSTFVTISGQKASVLIPNLRENSSNLVEFLYENDIPARVK